MALNDPSYNRSGSRKRRHQDRRVAPAFRFSSVNSRLTNLHCLAFLLLTSGAMGKIQVVALSYHTPHVSASPAFVSSHKLPVRSIPNTVTSQQTTSSQGIRSTKSQSKTANKKNHKSSVTFVGDSTTTLELDAPMELVQEFLQSDGSNAYLLGTDDIKCQKSSDSQHINGENQLFECKQPVLEFMGLKLQPIFQHKLYRRPNQVTASIEEGSKAEIVAHSRHPAKRVISSLVKEATFAGESVVTVHPSQQQQKPEARLCSTSRDQQTCKLSIALSLSLKIPMPRFIPIPPGFNALGSVIVRRTGRLRTQQLLERLKAAYYEHQEQKQQQDHQEGDFVPALPTVPSFEDNFRRILAIA